MPSESRAKVFAGRLALIVAALAAPGCAGGRGGSERGLPGVSQEKAPPFEGEVSAPVREDAGSANAEDAGEEDLEESSTFDEAMLAITRQQQASKRGEPPLGVRFGVVERGPGKRWLLALLNEGEDPVRVIADQRLLWFEVEVPGKRAKKKTCRLPDALFPARIDHRAEIVLEPGQAIADSFGR